MSDTRKSGHRIEPETLAAYLDGRLDRAERERVEAAITSDPESYEWLVHSMRAEQHVNAVVAANDPDMVKEPLVAVRVERREIGPPKRRLVVAATVAALAGIAAVLLVASVLQSTWRLSPGEHNTDVRLSQLVAAVGDERFIEGRLTGGFKYAPIRPVTRASSDLSSQNLALLAAAGELQKAARANPTADNLHAWGLAQLLLGEFDPAIDTLSMTARLRPSSAAYLSDLAAAHLARYSATGSANDLPAAFERVEQALAIAPESEEGLFNRVRVLSAMGLPNEARAALQNYLRRDPSSAWATEAMQIVDGVKPQSALDPELGAAIAAIGVSSTPDGSDWQAIREFIEEELLGRYIRTMAPSERPAALDHIARAASRLAALQGDALLTDAISEWQHATAARADAMSRAFECYAQARALQRDVRPTEMGQRATRCSTLFRELSSPFVRWTMLLEARAAQTNGDLERARSLAGAVLAQEESAGFRITAAAAQGQLGTIAFLTGQYGKASEVLAGAIDLFVSAGEVEQAAQACNLRGGVLFESGDRPQAWAEQLRALHFLPERRQTITWWYATRTGVALELLKNDWPHAATAILSRNLESASANRLALGVSESNRYLARAKELLGDPDSAVTHLEAAERAWADSGDVATKDRSHAELLWAKARRLAETAPEQALQFARDSQAIFRRLGIETRLAPVKLFEVRAALKAEGPARAIEAADEGVRLVSEQERQLPTVRLRDAFRLANADIYREASAVLVEANEPRGSLLRIEQFHRLTGNLPAAADLDVARSRLAGGTVAIAFAFRTGVLHRWVIDREGVTLRTVAADPARVMMLASGVKATLQVGADVRTAFNRELSTLLLDGLPRSAQRAERWVIVPDGPVFGVPFSMLLEDDGVIAERREVTVASSFLEYVNKHTDTPSSTPSPGRAAVFAATNTAMKVRALPGALQESTRVAALYAVTPLTGIDATPAAFLAALGRDPIVHFSGHAILNTHVPGRSLLLLSPTDREPFGALFQADVEQVQAHTRVVVLAGCSTADNADTQGEGVSSIARSFVKAGVPWVIATLWPIADQPASDVFVELHQLLLRNIPPPTAVAMIQSQAARAGKWDPVRSSLVVFGA